MRTCQTAGIEISAEMQAAARRVLDENKRLRHLLKQRGLTDADIESASTQSSAEIVGSSTQNTFSSTSARQERQAHDPVADLASLLDTHWPCTTATGCNTGNRASVSPSVTSPASAASAASDRRESGAIMLMPAQNPGVSPMPSTRPRNVDPAYGAQPTMPQQRGVTNTAFQRQQPNMDPTRHPQNAYPHPTANATYDYATAWPQGQPHTYPQPQSVANNYRSTSTDQTLQDTQTLYSNPHTDFNSSSCRAAASVISDLSGRRPEEVSRALGCGDCADDSNCTVDNAVVFELMDQFSAPVQYD